MLFFKAPRPIALLSDFGSADGYTGVVKGVITSLSKRIPIFDITHDIPPGNILSASYILASVFDWLPENTVVWAVVDPGVGTARNVLCAKIKNRYVVTPDNGLMSMLIRLKNSFPIFECDQEAVLHFTGKHASATFHGRDIFAPAAALIAVGKSNRIIIKKALLASPVILPEVYSQKTENVAKGYVIHIDRFGNAATSIRREEVNSDFGAAAVKIKECAFFLERINTTFADVSSGKPLLYFNSSGFLEIAVRDGNASVKYGIKQGMQALVRFV